MFAHRPSLGKDGVCHFDLFLLGGKGNRREGCRSAEGEVGRCRRLHDRDRSRHWAVSFGGGNLAPPSASACITRRAKHGGPTLSQNRSDRLPGYSILGAEPKAQRRCAGAGAPTEQPAAAHPPPRDRNMSFLQKVMTQNASASGWPK